MADWYRGTKSEIIGDTERDWKELNGLLGQLTDAQMTDVKDAEGWSIKDHLTHLAAWERSALYFLQGKPRYEALGIDEALFMSGDFNAINDAVQKQNKDVPLAGVLADLRNTNERILAELAPLSDDALKKSYKRFPDEPGSDTGRPASDVVYSNTADHVAEHLGYIRALAGQTN
jgi:hypothetical protein